MKKTIVFFIAIYTFTLAFSNTTATIDTLVFGFYNLENLFDTIDDPNKNDEDFLPESPNNWNEERLTNKMQNLARVIKDMKNGECPDILGFCESENYEIVNRLNQEHLKCHLEIAYLESPDNRGIDVGLFYNKKYFDLQKVMGDTVQQIHDFGPTRLILTVALKIRNTEESIYVIVNHWPSRRGGDKSQEFRIQAATKVRERVDKILDDNKNANILIIGDFNDEPNDISLKDFLKAYLFLDEERESGMESDYDLFNLSYGLKSKGEGTYRYQSNWNMLDQMIVSRNLLFPIASGQALPNISGGQAPILEFVPNSFEIFRPDYIITKEGRYAGTSIPTYGGRTYLGGFSDHFSIIGKFTLNIEK